MEHSFRKRVPVRKEFKLPSRAIQDARDECDVNVIMAKYQKTGLIKHRDQNLVYGDFSRVADYHEAMNVVANANTMFFQLPSSIRERFDNDPGKFLAFASDEKNEDAMIEMKLKKPKVVVKPEEAVPSAKPEEPPKPEPPKQ